MSRCVPACVRACMRACVRTCVQARACRPATPCMPLHLHPTQGRAVRVKGPRGTLQRECVRCGGRSDVSHQHAAAAAAAAGSSSSSDGTRRRQSCSVVRPTSRGARGGGSALQACMHCMGQRARAACSMSSSSSSSTSPCCCLEGSSEGDSMHACTHARRQAAPCKHAARRHPAGPPTRPLFPRPDPQASSAT